MGDIVQKIMRQILARTWWRLVLFGFRLLYNELAWTYDLVSWLVSFGQWREWHRAGLAYIEGSDVLELAHGPGHMLLALRQAGCRVVGCDLSPHMGRLARRRLQKIGVAIPLVRGRAEDMPFAGASFDTVLATFPAPFIADPQTIAALHRVIRPGGRLVIVPEAHLTGRGPLSRLVEWLYAITGQRQGPAADEPLSPVWSALAQRFSDGGFELRLERVRLPRSVVTVVVASRQERTLS
jgi:ubiquinone/menaquinone biosynthesis C-methylase UbiE